MNLWHAAICVVAAGFLSGCGGKEAEKPLIVGMELAYPPFEMTDERGNPDGVSVRLAEALGESLGREVRIRNMAFDGLVPSLASGQIDLIISSLTVTPERARSIAFSEAYLTTGLCILAGVKSGVRSIEDLGAPHRTVAVKRGTTGHLFARENLRESRVRVLDRDGNAALEVAQGVSDAFLYDQLSVLRHWRRNPDTTRALLSPFRVEQWAIGLRQSDTVLLAEVNAFLENFKRAGGFDRLSEEFLSEEKKWFEEAGIPFLF